jgi:hypothetical protein
MKWEVKIKLDAKQIYCQEMGWIFVAYNKDSARIVVNKIMNFEFHKMLEDCELLTKNSSSLKFSFFFSIYFS